MKKFGTLYKQAEGLKDDVLKSQMYRNYMYFVAKRRIDDRLF